ncbi:hypothetical protein [Leptospira ryugenii]|uniref:hypothetical protein n=1 Tax=Leptospira ryugenii TaxID=1917863 RepID=UPI000D599B22|nr:hypothetical protein [Leptospira ryugenii]
MVNEKLTSYAKKVVILTIFLAQTFSCEKKDQYNDADFFTGLLLYNLALDPVCSSFTPETAVTLSNNESNGVPDYYGDISATASVPPGKQCYYKFTPTSAGIYVFSAFGSGTGSFSSTSTSKGIYHLGLVGKTPTKIPSTTSFFDDENLFTNVPASYPSETTVVTDPQFYQSANSTRFIIADGTNCTSNCKIGLKIVKRERVASANISCSGTDSKSINTVRFDETGVSISSIGTPCYMLFVSPRSTIMQLTQTRTDSGVTTPTMTLSVSNAVTNTASTFTSATSTTSTTAATLNGLVTPAGSGRYIETRFSPTPTGFAYRITNSY